MGRLFKKGDRVNVDPGYGEEVPGVEQRNWIKIVEDGNPFTVTEVFPEGQCKKSPRDCDGYSENQYTLVSHDGEWIIYAHECRMSRYKDDIQVGTKVRVRDNSYSTYLCGAEIIHPPFKLTDTEPWIVLAMKGTFPSETVTGKLVMGNDIMLRNPDTGNVVFSQERFCQTLDPHKLKTIRLDKDEIGKNLDKWQQICTNLQLCQDLIAQNPCYFCTVFDIQTKRGFCDEIPCPLLKSCGNCTGGNSYEEFREGLNTAHNRAERILREIKDAYHNPYIKKVIVKRKNKGPSIGTL